jgi:hypothetical protein
MVSYSIVVERGSVLYRETAPLQHVQHPQNMRSMQNTQKALGMLLTQELR